MACGSLFATESQLGRDLPGLDPTRSDLTSDLSRKKRESPPVSRSASHRSSGDVHEAIRFLQAEHEAVLQGLHQQIQALQQRCDDLQFEVHLRHVTLTDEETWRAKVSELNKLLEERTQRVAQLEAQLEAQRKLSEEEQQQHRWREVQLQQQVEAGERRVADLRGEVSRLRSQVRDLRVYSSALRTVGGRAAAASSSSRAASRSSLSNARPLSRTSRASVGSQESLESCGPRSLGSEDGEAGSWREARLGGGLAAAAAAAGRNPRAAAAAGARAPLSPTPRSPAFSLPPPPLLLASSPPSSLPPLQVSLPPQRPASSSVVLLPPISAVRGGVGVASSRHVRRQLRLGSAPALDIDRSDLPPQRDSA